MTHWASVPSFGCFIHFSGDVPVRALLEELVTKFDLAREAQVSTKNYQLRWKKFSWKVIDAAISDAQTLSIAMLVGTPTDVRLGGMIWLRNDPAFPGPPSKPLLTWFGAESGRWPEPVFTSVARNWLHIAASQGNPLSGGVLAAANLRNAKIEMTREFETSPGQGIDRSPTSFTGRLVADPPSSDAWEQISRVYPVTLLGPKFASQIDYGKLVAAGAKNVEQVNGSIIFDASEHLLEAWSPEYLAATVELRRLLWPLSFQNPADDPDPPRRRH